MGADAIFPTYKLKLDNTDLSATQLDRLDEIVVEQSVHLPHMAVLRFVDVGDETRPNLAVYYSLVDGATFTIGKELEVQLGYGTPTSIFKGEITAVELDASADDPRPVLTVRAYSRGHRLHRGRQTRSFLAMSDSDVVSKVAQECGLTATVTATTPVHDYTMQYNQTNGEFVRDLAARNGFEAFVDGKVLYFRKPKNGSDAETAPEQKLWESLIDVRVKMSAAQQPSEVNVRGWSPKTKAAIVGTASAGSMKPSNGVSSGGAATASSAGWGAAKLQVVNQPVFDQTAATNLAKAIFDEFDGAFIEAEGTCGGDPGLKAGKVVQLGAIGTKFAGKYYLTSVVHKYSIKSDYVTSFSASARRSNTLYDHMQSRSQGDHGIPGAVIGVVTNVTDPDDQGRVKVKFPWIADNQESFWARIASPMAGSGRGFMFLPEVNDEVLVVFEHGDPSRAYVVGQLWNAQDLPPKKNSEVSAQGKVNLRILKSRSGHTITLDDTQGAEKIEIVDKTTKNKITIDSASNKITIEAEADVAITAKGKAEITATGDCNIEAQNAKITAKQAGTITANQKLTLKGTQGVDIEGAQINIKASATAEVSAGAALTLKGGVVKIN
jgi:phage protein D/phage baseplate assembly protein gpV